MLKRKLLRRVLSRLLSGVFAVQLIAAGFCLMMPQAHAMPMLKAAHAMSDSMTGAGRCSQAVQSHMSHDAEHSSYSHCDQFDSFLQNISTPVQPDLEMQADLPPAPIISEWISRGIPLYSRTPTGPPRSSTLLYTTTQRIRV